MPATAKFGNALLSFLHPFFFALYPILNLYAANVDQVTFSQVQRSLLIFIGLAALFLAIFWLLVRDLTRAGLAASLVLLLVFTFGLLQSGLRGLFPENARPVWMGALFAAWLGLFAWFGWRLAFCSRRPLAWSKIFSLAGGFLIFIAGANLGVGLARRPAMAAAPPGTVAPQYPLPQVGVANSKPDIYYIILDDYGQGQMLADLYGLDNSAFLDGLRERGFTVAEDSHSNYNQTILALASTLNLDYLDQLVELVPAYNDRRSLIERFESNIVMRFLKAQGYQTIVVASGYEFTEIGDADLFLSPRLGINAFETMLFSSAFSEFGMKQVMGAAYRAEVRERFRIVENLASRPGPKFVFAHIVLPHPPFVFTAEGRPREPVNLTFADGSHLGLAPGEYIEAYSGQLLYANRLAAHLVDAILERSPGEPLIILQGDHGPGAYLDWESLENSCIRERLSILNAYYLPGGKSAQEVGLHPGVTPVNTFRLLFDTYLGTQLGALDDRSFFAIWNRPQNLVDVTERLGTCAPVDK